MNSIANMSDGNKVEQLNWQEEKKNNYSLRAIARVMRELFNTRLFDNNGYLLVSYEVLIEELNRRLIYNGFQLKTDDVTKSIIAISIRMNIEEKCRNDNKVAQLSLNEEYTHLDNCIDYCLLKIMVLWSEIADLPIVYECDGRVFFNKVYYEYIEKIKKMLK